MIKIILSSLSLLIVSIPCICQTIPCDTRNNCADAVIPTDEAGRYEFQQVIAVPGATADQLYKAAKIWIANTYKSPEVIQLDDPESFLLICDGWSPIPKSMVTHQLWHKIKIEAKDGRFRYTIYELEYDFGPEATSPYKEWLHLFPPEERLRAGKRHRSDKKLREGWVLTLNDLITGLEKGIPASLSSNDDAW
jgi:hypothetical protein